MTSQTDRMRAALEQIAVNAKMLTARADNEIVWTPVIDGRFGISVGDIRAVAAALSTPAEPPIDGNRALTDQEWLNANGGSIWNNGALRSAPAGERPTLEDVPLVIDELRAAGSDGGEFMGYFARGHFTEDVFIRAAKVFARENDIWFEPRNGKVRQGWWRTTMIQGDPGEFQFSPSRPGPGAWAVTYIDTFGPSLTQRNAEYKMGRAAGYDDGVGDMMQFAYEHLGGWHNDTAKQFETAARAWRQGAKP